MRANILPPAYLHVIPPLGRVQVVLQLLGMADAKHEHFSDVVTRQELERVVDHWHIHQWTQNLLSSHGSACVCGSRRSGCKKKRDNVHAHDVDFS